MKNTYRLSITSESVTQADFAAFYKTASSYAGTLQSLRFHVTLSRSAIQYYVESDKDLSSLSNQLSFAVIEQVESDEVRLPANASKEHFVNYVNGGSLLDLREKMSVKRGKNLDHFVCDVQRITDTKAKVTLKMYFEDPSGAWSVSTKIATEFPSHLFAIDFANTQTIMKSETPKHLNIQKSLHLFSPTNSNSLLEIDTYPYFSDPYYLNLPSYEFDKHSLIVGATGSGKSKFIQLFIDRLQRIPNSYDYKVVVIDPHDSLANDLASIPNNHIVNFGNESTKLFASNEADITAATELTTTLMRDLLAESYNARVERVLRFSLYILFTQNNMSMRALKDFLTQTEIRTEILREVEGRVPHNITQFFNTEFNEIRTGHYTAVLLPIVSLVDELELQPTLVNDEGSTLLTTMQENFLTVFSLNKITMGEKTVKTVAGLLIQQIFLLAQARAFGQKIILFIDEVSIVQNPALTAILSEARKYNLFVVLTQQYLSQVDQQMQHAMFANITNYYCFRTSEEDALKLVGNLPMEHPHEILRDANEKGIDEKTVSARLITNLHPRECIVRVAAGGKLLPCFKAKTIYIDSETSTSEESITVNTHLDKHNVLKAYEGEITDLSSFLERADNLPAGTAIDVPKATESPPRHAETNPTEHIPDMQTTTSLDDIMNQTSSKDIR